MIQLSSKNKILVISLALIFLVIVIFLVIKLNKNNNSENEGNQIIANGEVVREMSEEERTEKVGIVEAAEVVNEQDGLYIYKIKK